VDLGHDTAVSPQQYSKKHLSIVTSVQCLTYIILVAQISSKGQISSFSFYRSLNVGASSHYSALRGVSMVRFFLSNLTLVKFTASMLRLT
jgi:hypothetical protein